ncbi:MAG TPA: tetratricopeptide repeat-containing protein [Pyrinomonadaceae bacterium]|jgi:predicted acylesterase/phospholipase RssA|nr:tetratricopeptide repeat-containing protein [Pyrinomonadaceae bacterium]
MTQEEKQLLIKEAENILRGTDRSPGELFKLAKQLKKAEQFTYARKILARAREDDRIEDDKSLRLEIFQQSALCTYKDEELPADARLDRALKILHKGDDLSKTVNQETLGLAGGIYKRKWEVDSQPAQLERSLAYYMRGYAQGAEGDQGYTGINAAYILDLLAHQEEEEADEAKVPPDGGSRKRIAERRQEAASIREDLTVKVAELIHEGRNDWLKGEWWFYSTVAEAYFGLGTTRDPATGAAEYDEAMYEAAIDWLEKGRVKAHPPVWEFESTARQLASIARLQSPPGVKGKDLEGTPPWRALEKFLGRTDPVRSAFVGKIGLGLSGGGFRASLFHIGVFARLAEMDALRSVEVLSCVSGGSIIGAHYYLEVRKLLESKPDEQITKQDYIELVERVARDFLKGVQTNIRTLIAAEPWTNLKMIFGADTLPRKWIFGPSYSRTMRAGELYESKIFSLVKDGTGEKDPRWLNDLRIHPVVKDGDATRKQTDFNPKRGNWMRGAKVPILILNAATLNTGHSWHFTASYMGEPPAGIDSRIDSNDRFRRMYYGEAPEGYKCMRLGHAVAASACVPGLFEPLAFPRLYPDRVVRLIDGGTCDNQGVGGLLEQDCNVILISDGSGQMESQKDPSRGLLGVPLRSTSILQARVRQSQFQDLSARRRSRLLRGMMFVHLKNDLDVDPVDWVDCMDPTDANDEDTRRAGRRGKLTSYGIAKDIQQCLASVRTDLDSFSEVEAYALMTSGYRQTEYAFREEKCVQGFESEARTLPWKFLKVEEGMKGAGRSYQHVKRLLSVSDVLAFKIWKLKKWLKVVAVALAVIFAAIGAWACWYFRDTMLVQAITVGAIAMFFAGLALTALGTAFVGKRLMRIMRLRETLVRAAVGVFVGVAGSIAALIHLKFFDPMFLREGSLKNYESNIKVAEQPCGKDAGKRIAEKHAPALAEAKEAAIPAPARAEASVVEVVGAPAPADALHGHATPGAHGGNGHTKGAAPEEPFPDTLDTRDPKERQD